MPTDTSLRLDPLDLALIQATQGGLPLVPRPYHAIGEGLGVSGEEVMQRLRILHQVP